VFAEYGRQKALYRIFVTPNHEQQMELIHQAVRRQSDFEAISLASGSLVKGLLGAIRSGRANQTIIMEGVEQLGIYGDYWRSYIEANPDDYRARMNHVYQLLFRTTLGDNRLEEAKTVIAGSYELSPQNPITYALDGVALLYSGDVEGAKAKMNEAVALNPDAPFSQEMRAYIERQEASFPTVTILELGNL
jgi:tetratricopeptide (TPR) repeat protein